jgi:hypothetical protein
VDQFVPALHRGDAIGDTAIHMRDFLRGRGFAADIYCLERDRELEDEARPFAAFPAPAPEDVAILHFALPSPLSQALTRLRCRRFIIHHNITPPNSSPFSDEFAASRGWAARAGVPGAVRRLGLADWVQPSRTRRARLPADGRPALFVDFRSTSGRRASSSAASIVRPDEHPLCRPSP